MSDVGEVSPASVFAELQAGEWEDARSAASLPTRLKRQRELCSLTQEELAERSGISLRSIQMYEQRQKNTNRASAEAVYRLACALRCSMEGQSQNLSQASHISPLSSVLSVKGLLWKVATGRQASGRAVAAFSTDEKETRGQPPVPTDRRRLR